jgi:hypothetical protein
MVVKSSEELYGIYVEDYLQFWENAVWLGLVWWFKDYKDGMGWHGMECPINALSNMDF